MIEKIDKINQALLSVFSQNLLPLGLARGRMGICIYFFESGRLRNNKNHTKIAEEMLDGILNDINQQLPLGLEDGLAGIGYGIRYLIQNKYVKGDVNKILSDIDNEIIKKISYPDFFERPDAIELIGLLYYFSVRASDINKNDKETLYIYQEITINLINQIYPIVTNTIGNEPLSFKINYHLPVFLYLLSQIYTLDFYNYRITKIIDEMTPRVLSQIPYVHANRLFLLWGMNSINNFINSREWADHINLLKSRIDMNKILWEEMRNQNVYFEDGITSILMILQSSGIISYDSKIFLEKLKKTDVWDMLQHDRSYFWQHMGLINGFCGITLAYLKLSGNR